MIKNAAKLVDISAAFLFFGQPRKTEAVHFHFARLTEQHVLKRDMPVYQPHLVPGMLKCFRHIHGNGGSFARWKSAPSLHAASQCLTFEEFRRDVMETFILSSGTDLH